MDRPAKKLLRCAVYTRKSTEHNLDLEFNSLDAQREACEAYIKSQAHEGWRLIPGHYDDGAFSGASLDRPALQDLLAQVRAGQIDIIVVYKVDRLTRSLADFAKLVELFDQYSVSFVSVTQSFNTTSSMGRLTLNVLLSFAQFEREVIGERVRDKIAASKRKGIWVGGPVPLGYASVGKKLIVVPEEAKTVRLIFHRYLEVGSIRDLAEDLDRRGVRTKRQSLASGKTRGGIPFGVGALANLLRNRFYTGEIVYRGARHPGEHEAIVEQSLFEAVQAKLAAGAQARQLKLRASPAILTGRIFDEHRSPMTPTHTNKRGARYRYYISHSALQKRSRGMPPMRVPAQEVEELVVRSIREYLGAQSGKQFTALGDRELIERYVARVSVGCGAINIQIIGDDGGDFVSQRDDSPHSSTIEIAWTKDGVRSKKGVLHQPPSAQRLSIGQRDLLLKSIAKARSWIDDLATRRVDSFAEIAKQEGKVERHIRLLAPLAFASPQAVSDIVDGSFPPVGVTEVAKTMPYLWAEQSRTLRGATTPTRR